MLGNKSNKKWPAIGLITVFGQITGHVFENIERIWLHAVLFVTCIERGIAVVRICGYRCECSYAH